MLLEFSYSHGFPDKGVGYFTQTGNQEEIQYRSLDHSLRLSSLAVRFQFSPKFLKIGFLIFSKNSRAAHTFEEEGEIEGKFKGVHWSK